MNNTVEYFVNKVRKRFAVAVEITKLAYTNFKDTSERAKLDLLLEDSTPAYLQNRVVWCPDCGSKQQLTVTNGSHVVVCSGCYGHNWVYYTNKYFFEYPRENNIAKAQKQNDPTTN